AAGGVQVGAVLAERRQEAELVERGGTQAVDQPADLVDGGRGVGPQRAEQVAGGVGGVRDAGQGGTEAVVQVVPEAAPVVLDGRHHTLARVLEVGRER